MKHRRLLFGVLLASGLMAQTPRGGTSEADLIAAARRTAAEFTRSLPDYAVRRTTERYRNGRVVPAVGGAEVSCSGTQTARGTANCQDTTVVPAWHLLDTVTADILSERGNEVSRNVRVDGRSVDDPGKTGWWSEGEFSNTMNVILAAESKAKFWGAHSVTLAGRRATRYDYAVEQSNSIWRVAADSVVDSPAHTGAVWIDGETSGVLRIEMEARNLPAKFPLKSATTAVEYGFVKIGKGKYLLPVNAETVVCQRYSTLCSRNATVFHDYRRYSADSQITFDDTGAGSRTGGRK